MTIELTVEHRGGTGSSTFSGRDEGAAVRKVLNIDKLDKEDDCHVVRIPNDTTSFNPSFFLGLFYPSVKFYGSVEKFRERYAFDFTNFENEEMKKCMEDDLEDNCRRCNDELNKTTGLD